MTHITREIETGYIETQDKTIIFEVLLYDNERIAERVVGWYHGEADEDSTKTFSNKLTAIFDLTGVIDKHIDRIEGQKREIFMNERSDDFYCTNGGYDRDNNRLTELRKEMVTLTELFKEGE